MEQHFVEFFSPGTFISESSVKPVDSWDVPKAIEMARSIKERHGATPYGFRFTTRGRSESELDSRVVAKSKFYWLGGKIETYEEVCNRNDPKEDVLRSNMEGNKWKNIIVNTNSWKYTSPFDEEKDIYLEFTT